MKSPLAFAVVLLVAAAAGVWMTCAGGLSAAAGVRVEPGSDAVVGLISEGEAVDLREHCRSRGRTVFFFTKPWCGGCWRIAPRVEEAVRDAGDATLRVIDIGSWRSDVARQHGIRVAPHLQLWVDGELVAAGTEQVLERLAR